MAVPCFHTPEGKILRECLPSGVPVDGLFYARRLAAPCR